MSWFPIGPDMVFAPRIPNFKRLSRRNEFGQQGLTSSITLDPTDANTIYIVERPSSGGTSAFRTRDDGASWTPIADALQQVNAAVDPYCFAVNPDHPETIYMGTLVDQGIYVSSNRGEPGSWSSKYAIRGHVRKLIVDPRTSATLMNTVLYAATDTGVYRSPDGGQNWTLVQSGDCWTLAAWMPNVGTAHFYAGIWQQGVFYTTDPTKPWTNLNAAGIGLPAHTFLKSTEPEGNFNAIFVDFCRLNPTCAYAWFTTRSYDPYDRQITTAIYTTSSPMTRWTQVAAVAPPDPWYNFYAWSFGVAPNSPGKGSKDILLFGSGRVQRSVDSGKTWEIDGTWFHHDQHAIAFSPEVPASGTIPATYIGCDGGIAKSTKFADPTVAITAPPPDYNEGTTTADTFAWQNKNHGKQSSAVYQYASHPSIVALSYIGCQDTGVAAGDSALGWRGIADADGSAIAAAPASNGVAVWGMIGAYRDWPAFRILRWLDRGEFAPSYVFATLSGSLLNGTSNYVVGVDNKCLAGVIVQPNRLMVVRIDEAGAATQISQDFVAQGNVFTVAVHPMDPNILYCATSNQKLWMTRAGAAAGPGTVWSEIATGKPSWLSISSIAIAPGGQVYVQLRTPVAAGGVTTPLFEVSTGTWLPQRCAGLPMGGFGKLVADPVAVGTLYASSGSKVLRLTLAAGTWTSIDISDGLPGPPIYDLWIGTIGSGAGTKVLLRAAIPTRAIWERDITAGATDAPIALYVRDNFLDQGWLNPSLEGIMNPYNPVPSDRLWHYLCADIKIDAQQIHTVVGQPDFFQTNPEGMPIPPLNHVLFDELRDASQNLPQTDAALVHVHVRNRSTTPAQNVSVWAIYCRASGGVPALSASPSKSNAFPFWNQFSSAGIVPALPADSPWKAVGAPQVLSGITAATPKVASWSWGVPSLPSGDPGHYCVVTFIHSAASPIGETGRMNVDAIAQTNKQVGQKNLHIGPPLSPGPVPADGLGSAATGVMEEYIEFHNPTNAARVADLHFDLRNLPPELGVSFHLANVQTERPLADALAGVATTTEEPVAKKWRRATRRLSLLARLLTLLQRLWCWLVNLVRALLGRPKRRCGRRSQGAPLPQFGTTRFLVEPSALVEVRGVQLPPFGFCATLLRIELRGALEQGSTYIFDVQQLVREDQEHLEGGVGGSRYVVVIMGEPKLRTPVVAPSHDPNTPPDERERIIREGKALRYLPPWAEELAAAREEEQHKG